MRAILKRIISHPDLAEPALKAFTDYPALEEVTTLFLSFVPPWLVEPDGSSSVAENAIRKALLAYEQAEGGNGGGVLGHRRYIEEIAETAKVLSSLRVSVLNCKDQWEIWNYDQPLVDYMSAHKRWVIQIREREQPIASDPVMIKLLAAITSTREMVKANLDMSSLFTGCYQ